MVHGHPRWRRARRSAAFQSPQDRRKHERSPAVAPNIDEIEAPWFFATASTVTSRARRRLAEQLHERDVGDPAVTGVFDADVFGRHVPKNDGPFAGVTTGYAKGEIGGHDGSTKCGYERRCSRFVAASAPAVLEFPFPMLRTKLVLSKSAFIRSQAAKLSTDEIVAKVLGFDVTPQLVASLRRRQKPPPKRTSVPKTVPISRTEFVRRLRTLTAAQREVARLACLGFSNSEVARKRQTAVPTVAKQMHDLLEKLGVRSRQALAVWYWQELARGGWRTLDAIGLTGTDNGMNAAMSKSLAVSWRMLAPRQRRMLELLAGGYLEGAIAMKLRMPPSTVSSMLVRARKRLGLYFALRGPQPSMAALFNSVVAAPGKMLAAEKARQRPKSPPKKPTIFKSDFIRAQPAALSPLEVLALAHKAGIKVTRQHVYAVRSRGRSKNKMAAVKKGPRASSPTKSKSALIRSPSHLTAKEMLAKAVTEGIEQKLFRYRT
jgi:DNA-binding NarL/FixJ family response regulator